MLKVLKSKIEKLNENIPMLWEKLEVSEGDQKAFNAKLDAAGKLKYAGYKLLLEGKKRVLPAIHDKKPEVKEVLYRPGDKTCLKSHPLSNFSTDHSGFGCDFCGMSQVKGASMGGCRQCDFDICRDCLDVIKESEEGGGGEKN